MTLPFEVPSAAWPGAFIGSGLLWWVYRRPAHHWMKQLWWTSIESKASDQAQVIRWFGGEPRFSRRRAEVGGKVVFAILQAIFLTAGIVGLLVATDILQNPQRDARLLHPTTNPADYEIVTEGQTIYARPKVK